MTLAQSLKALRKPLLADGKIDFAETAVLMRALRPFFRNGEPEAIELDRKLVAMREDGVIKSSVLACADWDVILFPSCCGEIGKRRGFHSRAFSLISLYCSAFWSAFSRIRLWA